MTTTPGSTNPKTPAGLACGGRASCSRTQGAHVHIEEALKLASTCSSAFTDGKRYPFDTTTTRNPWISELTEQQRSARSLSAGEHPLTEDELSSGQTARLMLPLGKLGLLASGGWRGRWHPEEETTAKRYADAYAVDRERAHEVLGAEYLAVLNSVRRPAT